MDDVVYDLCVIGGGVNGAGIARDAAGRGLSVILLEAKDLGGATSSSSTKLIHGGLRYLEYFEFHMVREALKERERLLKIAPHIIWPMDFILPHTPEQRTFWMIRLGLFLYDHLARREILKGSQAVDLSESGGFLKEAYKKGFRYSDCWVDDSRLVVLNAMDAAARGANILTYTSCRKIEHDGDCWVLSAFDERKESDFHVRASMVVNAAGPWVSDILQKGHDIDLCKHVPRTRLVKGSHVITERLYEGDEAFVLQQPDGRICFVIPYEGKYTLIGTTEEDYSGDPRDSMLSDDEMAYLIAAHNRFFDQQISSDDVLWSYSGVRPLFDDGDEDASSVTRDFKLHWHEDMPSPFLSVFGGKITTYRVLAEQAMSKLLHLDNRYAPPWTQNEALPGGDFSSLDVDGFVQQQASFYEWLPEDVLQRYIRSYGTAMDVFLQGAKSAKDLGKHFGDHVYEAEIVYLLRYEFAKTSEDIFWRRSKLGLHVADKTIKNVEAYLKLYHKRAGAHG